MSDDPTTDPTLDRLLRHMAWANATLIGWLGTLSDDALVATAPQNEWSAGRILDHLVNAAGGYATRLDGGARLEAPPLMTSISQLEERAARLAGYDARLLAHAAQPEGRAAYAGDDRTFARSTVLGQAIHHATEHRAQIAGALATNGINAIDLDALDVWAYGEAEGLGD
jgi:uncharacterized damage-inducible protein DinB